MASEAKKPFQSIFKDSPRKALVGRNKTIFHVQPGALVQGSSALTARVNGVWKDTGQETLNWCDFDEETIDCVLRYCYGRRYEVPWQSEIDQGNSVLEAQEQDVIERESERDEDYTTEPCSPFPGGSYTGDAILLHAKIYIFAHRYLFDDLQRFALAHMEDCFEPCVEELSICPRATSRCLAAAVRIIYGGTPSSKTDIDPARKQLCEFIADSHKKLNGHFAFFQRETGDFMTDLACKLSALIQSSQDANADLENKCNNKDASLAAWRSFYENYVPAKTRQSIAYAMPR